MVSKNTELVNHKGSPVLPAHGCGGTRASKNETATNPPSEDATEGGGAGEEFRRARADKAPPPALLGAEPSKIPFSFSENF